MFNKTFAELAVQIDKISQRNCASMYSLYNFFMVFDIKFYLFTNSPYKGVVSYLKVTDAFFQFVIDNVDLYQDYYDDFMSVKSPEDIAIKISQPTSKVIDEIRSRGMDKDKSDDYFTPKTYKYWSSYEILKSITKKRPAKLNSLHLIENNVNNHHDNINESKSGTTVDFQSDMGVVGYEDIKRNIFEQLDSIINPDDALDWGLNKSGGVLLYGPPGCGKTYWAMWIAKYIGFEFKEVPRSMFGSSLVDGAMNNLKTLLDDAKKTPKTLLFFDEFDSVASQRSTLSSGTIENSKVVNTLLQEIPKLIENDILVVGATNFIDVLDTAVIRPGRFDLKIPIFPPSFIERAKLLHFYLFNNLTTNSILYQILIKNKIYNHEYFAKYSPYMSLFSTSMIVDLSQIIKRRIKELYKSIFDINNIVLGDEFFNDSIGFVRGKLTKSDVEIYAQFFNEVNSLGGDSYIERTQQLLQELKFYYHKDADPPRPVGFRLPNIKKD